MGSKKLVGQIWTIVANGRCGHTSHSCFEKYIDFTVKLIGKCLTDMSTTMRPALHNDVDA